MQIKQTLLSWTKAANQESRSQLQPFLRNKLAQVVVLVIRVRTSSWPPSQSQNPHAGACLSKPGRPCAQLQGCAGHQAGPGAQEQYPAGWPGVFQELVQMAQDDRGAVDMLCRILTSLDDDVITLEVPRRGARTLWRLCTAPAAPLLRKQASQRMLSA